VTVQTIPSTRSKVKPLCAYFGTCGGCAYQDVAYDEQLLIKQKLVKEVLSDLQRRHPFAIAPTVPSPERYHYRRMISLTVKKRAGELKLGFIGWEKDPDQDRDKRFFIPIDACSIADDRLNRFIPSALAKLNEMPDKKRFRTSQIVLRVADGEEVVTSLRIDRKRELKGTIGGKTFSYSMSSFFQHNFSALNSLINCVRSLLDPDGGSFLLDLYCGAGLMSLLLADSYQSVRGIEEGYEAILYAKKNAESNGVANVSFVEGKVEAFLEEIKATSKRPLHVLVDPPRVGLKPEVIDCLKQLPLDRLVYVSCEINALKRDLELLEDRFLIKAVQPIDLFPQTRHVETVVLLEPRT
jgi:tRNA/tmRNA/rRNA uracil-C5-methylase (TrmA/RlmC/RlmD family)